jgi:hypothetical protein
MSDEELHVDLGELTAEQLGLTAEAPTGGITAFIVIKQPNGDWYATADLSTVQTVERQATVDDIKHGCQDIVDSMLQTNTAYQVLDLVKGYLKAEKGLSE